MKLPKNGLTDKLTSVITKDVKAIKGDTSNADVPADLTTDNSTNSTIEAPNTDDLNTDDLNKDNRQPKKSHAKNMIGADANNDNDGSTGHKHNSQSHYETINKAPVTKGSNVEDVPIKQTPSKQTASQQTVTNSADNSDQNTAKKENDADASQSNATDSFSVNQGIFANLFDKASKLSKSKLNRTKFDPSSVEGEVINNMQKMTTSEDEDVKTTASKPLRLTFLGGGSFGTAMSNLAARNGCDSTLWVRNKRTVKSLQKNRMNKKYLPGFTLDESLNFDYDLKAAIKDRDIIFVAVPSSAFRETLKKIAPYITGQSIVSLTKGMEKDTFALMSDIIEEELPEVNYGVMSGPNLAIEIMKNMPSASVIASESSQLRHAVQLALHSAFFRVFAADDVRGVELGGALKNIYAIAMGMAAYYNVGENTKAMLLTRALAEMSRFGAALGANPLTFLGLSGVGDLYATCSSELSRNYRIGNMLGKGLSLDAAIKKLGQTAEGINTIQQVHEKATKLGIYMPITHALYAVIYEDQAALGVALHLMEAGFRSDVEFVMPHEHSNDDLNAHIISS